MVSALAGHTQPQQRLPTNRSGLVEAVKGRLHVNSVWCRTKAELLEVDRLADYDRMAAIATDDVTIRVGGRQIVQSAFDSLAPQAGEVVGRFFETAGLTPPARASGAAPSPASTVPSGSSLRDAELHRPAPGRATLAHELGHGPSPNAAAAKPGHLPPGPPLTVARKLLRSSPRNWSSAGCQRPKDPGFQLGLLSGIGRRRRSRRSSGRSP